MTCYNMKSNTQAYSEWLNSKLSFYERLHQTLKSFKKSLLRFFGRA